MSCRPCAHITMSNIETSSALHVILFFCILSIKAKGESKSKKGKKAHMSGLRAVVFHRAMHKQSAFSTMNRMLLEDLILHQGLI